MFCNEKNYPNVLDSLQKGVPLAFDFLVQNEKLALINIWLKCMLAAR